MTRFLMRSFSGFCAMKPQIHTIYTDKTVDRLKASIRANPCPSVAALGKEKRCELSQLS
jgi:hypothetical protein